MKEPAAVPLPRLTLRSAALGEGYSANEIQLKRRQKEWFSVRPGAYVDRAEFHDLGEREKHLLLVKATAPRLPPDAVLSHVSAACLLGIELWRVDHRTVHIIRPGPTGGHRRPSMRTFRANVLDEETVIVGGLRLTDAARTLVDLARIVPFDRAVVATDFALHCGLVTKDQLTTALDRGARRIGMAAARKVVSFADGRSESAGESCSRIVIAAAGLPVPVLQFAVCTADGHLLGRGDFAWKDHRTIGEFDGAAKYAPKEDDDDDERDANYLEKLREDAIRRQRWHVVRWGWKDLDDSKSLAARIWRELQWGRQQIRSF